MQAKLFGAPELVRGRGDDGAIVALYTPLLPGPTGSLDAEAAGQLLRERRAQWFHVKRRSNRGDSDMKHRSLFAVGGIALAAMLTVAGPVKSPSTTQSASRPSEPRS